MSTARVLYHLAKADFLERTRTYMFLVTLLGMLYLGYAVNNGDIGLSLDFHRGLYNSAWVATLMVMVINVILGLAGFYLVKNTVTRDIETGVGQILATTPLSRPQYMLGKWLSNIVVLAVLVGILVLAALAMLFFQRESAELEIWPFLAPFLFVALPFMSLVAAFAVLFESVGFLRGGFGNAVYLFVWVAVVTVSAMLAGGDQSQAVLDPIGISVVAPSMGEAARAAYPDYVRGFSLSFAGGRELDVFVWPGLDWTLAVVLPRLLWPGLGLVVVLLAALFFDRFDATKKRIRSVSVRRPARETGEPSTAALPAAPRARALTLPSIQPSWQFARVLEAELRLSLQGQRWWWYAVTLALILASLVASLDTLRHFVLPVILAWPVFVWSAMGCREARHGTTQLVFSAPHPLARQLPATYAGGVAVAVAVGLAAAVRFAMVGLWAGVLGWLAACLFIPALALALGTSTRSAKAFEVVYLLLWYLGPLNLALPFDFLAVSDQAAVAGVPLYYLIAALPLFGLAALARARQTAS
ncbi:MAG: ABC transporter permease [Chloroflexota bacterium]